MVYWVFLNFEVGMLKHAEISRQGEILDHLTLVTTKRVLIDYEYMDPKHHFPGLYFFGTTSGVTWPSRALGGVHSQSLKFRLQI